MVVGQLAAGQFAAGQLAAASWLRSVRSSQFAAASSLRPIRCGCIYIIFDTKKPHKYKTL